MTPEEFWSKTLWMDDAEDACMIWTGATNCHGYGLLRVQGRLRAAHRVAYELAVGPIPPGLTVRRRCADPACVRPEHLTLSRPYRILSSSQVQAIRAALGSLGQIAKRYGIHRRYVLDIKTGKARASEAVPEAVVYPHGLA